MFFDQFDKDAMRLIMDAQTEARNMGSKTIGTDHLLLAASLKHSDVREALEKAGLSNQVLRKSITGNDAFALPQLDKIFAATSKDELRKLVASPEYQAWLVDNHHRLKMDDADGASIPPAPHFDPDD